MKAWKEKSKGVSAWSEEDVKAIEENSKLFNHWKTEERFIFIGYLWAKDKAKTKLQNVCHTDFHQYFFVFIRDLRGK